jgi:23S rRNA (pseudouridine1915-N3)-methyltransferase
MNITIIGVGKLKEAYWRCAADEYLKRLSGYAKIKVIEVNDCPMIDGESEKADQAIREKEGDEILAKLKPNDFVVLLDLNQKQFDSYSLADKINEWMVKGGSSITFVIGGSLGLGNNIKKRGNATLCLSSLTFTHQMTRIILLEQLYRSFRILNHEPYQK